MNFYFFPFCLRLWCVCVLFNWCMRKSVSRCILLVRRSICYAIIWCQICYGTSSLAYRGDRITLKLYLHQHTITGSVAVFPLTTRDFTEHRTERSRKSSVILSSGCEDKSPNKSATYLAASRLQHIGVACCRNEGATFLIRNFSIKDIHVEWITSSNMRNFFTI